MPRFIEQTFFVLVLMLLGPGGSLATKSVSMSNQPCSVRLTLIDLNHYYLFMISLDWCNRGCNSDEDPFGRCAQIIEEVNYAKKVMLETLAYVFVSVTDCDISEYVKDCTCIKGLVGNLAVSFDEIVDNPETILINSNDRQIIFLLLFSYCVFTIVGDHRSYVLFEAWTSNFTFSIVLVQR